MNEMENHKVSREWTCGEVEKRWKETVTSVALPSEDGNAVVYLGNCEEILIVGDRMPAPIRYIGRPTTKVLLDDRYFPRNIVYGVQVAAVGNKKEVEAAIKLIFDQIWAETTLEGNKLCGKIHLAKAIELVSPAKLDELRRLIDEELAKSSRPE